MNNNKVQFQTNVPRDIALRSTDGKTVPGDFGESVVFTTVDGQLMYLAPYVAEKLRRLNLQPGEPVRICKAQVQNGTKQSIEWQLSKLGEQPDGTFVVSGDRQTTRVSDGAGTGNKPTLRHPANGSTSPSPFEHSGTAMLMLQTVNMLTDVQATAMEYAKKYNGAIRPDDVRAMVLSVYINLSKRS